MGRPAPAAASQPAPRLARTRSGSWESCRASALPVELWQLPSLCLFFFFFPSHKLCGRHSAGPGCSEVANRGDSHALLSRPLQKTSCWCTRED